MQTLSLCLPHLSPTVLWEAKGRDDGTCLGAQVTTGRAKMPILVPTTKPAGLRVRSAPESGLRTGRNTLLLTALRSVLDYFDGWGTVQWVLGLTPT